MYFTGDFVARVAHTVGIAATAIFGYSVVRLGLYDLNADAVCGIIAGVVMFASYGLAWYAKECY